MPTGSFQQVERAGGIGIEVIKRNRGGAVVRGLGGRVDDDVRTHGRDHIQNSRAVPDVDFVVGVVRDGFGEPALVPTGIALRAKKYRALVVVQAVNAAALAGEKEADFRADEAGGAGDEDGFHEGKAEV